MQFKLTVYREPAGVSSISVDATDEQAALRQAVASGYLVLSTQRRDGWSLVRREGAFPVLLVSQELLSLLRAGVNLVEAFETLAEKEQAGTTRSVVERILSELYSGKPLSTALEAFPGVFSPLYIATIRASERTGDIVQALERYVAYQLQLERVRKMIVTAMIYPMLLIVVGGVVTLFLLGYVVPKFSRIFMERGTDLPLLTKVLVDWGNLINQYSWQTWIAIAGLIVLVVAAARRPEGRAFFVRQLWKIPGAGEKMRLYQLARLFRTVGMLLRGGMPIVSALSLVSGLLAPALRGQLAAATRQISDGGATSQAMLEHGLSTPVATRMLRVGEQTGDLGGMMEQIAAFYDEDVARTAELFTRTFEPALMVLIGLVIGSIVLLMYLPIFELASTME